MTPLRKIKQPSPRKILHQSNKQRLRCPKKRLKLALMHHARNRTSLTKATTVGKAARTVQKSPSPVKARIVVRPASSVIMEKIFRFGRQDQQLLKKRRTLTRKNQLSKNKSRKTTLWLRKRNFSRLSSMGLLFLTSFTIRPVMRTYPLWRMM